MFIKICANTNLADALQAEELGANALGFVFAPSPRQVTAPQVRAITQKLKTSIERIGVFSGWDKDAIVRAVREAGLTGIQLHEAYAPATVAFLQDRLGEGIWIIQTNHWKVGGQAVDAFANELRSLREEEALKAVLVDSRTMVADGGTGVAFDWSAAREAMQELWPKPLIVAGGLHAGNVAEAIATLRPWGVDVASGVEAAPGTKDWSKLRAFIANARSAQTTPTTAPVN